MPQLREVIHNIPQSPFLGGNSLTGEGRPRGRGKGRKRGKIKRKGKEARLQAFPHYSRPMVLMALIDILVRSRRHSLSW